MKTSRLRSNFSRKHTLRKANKTRKRKRTLRKRKTMKGGGNNFKKYDGYNVYDNPINTVSYSSPMEWDD